MIVARSFSPPSSSFMNEKMGLADLTSKSVMRERSRSPSQRSRSPRRSSTTLNRSQVSPSRTSRSSPVKIPSRNSKNTQQPKSAHTTPIAVPPNLAADQPGQSCKPWKESTQGILSATTIPARRRPRPRAAQRLPDGDHVAGFSKFLLDDVSPSRDGIPLRSQSLSQIDALFGNIDELVEGQFIVGSEPLDESGLSARSISSDSLASLSAPEDFGSSNNLEPRSNIGRSPQGRHTPRTSAAEDCSTDHPLASIDEIENLSLNSHSTSSSPSTSPPLRATSPPPRPPKKDTPRSSFKSTLTSSLKALKSAARTTLLSSSGFGPHGGVGASSLYSNESLLAHNFFDIQPSLTDDRRPPPSMTRPSPELRRYLNPQISSVSADSPTQLHFWQDEREIFDAKREAQLMAQKIKQKNKRKRSRSPAPNSKIDSLPAIVPLSTCLPPTVRTANASSPPIWLTPDGEPINKNTSNPLLSDTDATLVGINGVPRNREPRENRDFLRMYVGEMAMRRHGKLNEDASCGRARLWLPPMPSPPNNTMTLRKQGAERWKSWTAEDLQTQN